jgi:3-deoxy-D-manno-octulosonic acid kinase
VTERIEKLGKSVIVYDDSLVSQISEALFDPPSWDAAVPVPGVAGGRGTTLFVQHGGQDWALRHYHRGGTVMRMLRDRFLWTGWKSTRPLREWRLLSHLQKLGLPAPVPVAARCVRRGVYYSADLITQRLLGVVPFSSWLQQNGTGEEQWYAVGKCIARFHAVRVFHADLSAHNIQVDAAGRVYLLDFDRGQIMRSDGRWRDSNLVRLQRSLHKIRDNSNIVFGTGQWRALLQGYQQTSATASQRE